MAISFTYMDSETWMSYPRFWFRLALSLFFGFINFLYAVEWRMDFLDPAYQRLGTEKLLLFLIGAVLVSECIFHIHRAFGPLVKKNENIQGNPWFVMAIASVLSIVFLFVVAVAFEAVYNEPLKFEYGVLIPFVSSLMIIIINFVYMIFPLFLGARYTSEIIFDGPMGGQVLEVRDIAHILCCEKSFLFTYHTGESHEMQLENDLEKIYALLHPSMFFMVNDHAVVSRRACKQVLEDEDGRIRIVLEPRAKLPEHMIGIIDLEGLE